MRKKKRISAPESAMSWVLNDPPDPGERDSTEALPTTEEKHGRRIALPWRSGFLRAIGLLRDEKSAPAPKRPPQA